MKNEDVKVSVCCLVYNHEKYLRKCLDGFIMQKTNFAFEVLINDDKSTDSSAEIIKEYYEKYPDIIVPVFQTENQYSKGVKITDDILIPMAKGKYIALCEGDDYWCDENKLQLQYDYMESDKDCVMCLHNTVFHNLNGNHRDRLFNSWKTIHTLNAEEAFFKCCVHTSSYFIKKEYAKRPDIGRSSIMGDIVIRTWLYTLGKLVVLPQVMSVYNVSVPNGAMAVHSSIENVRKNTNVFIKYLEDLNFLTEGKFSDVIKKHIELSSFNMLCLEKIALIKNSTNKNDAVQAAKDVISHEYYSDFIGNCKGLQLLISRFKYEGYAIYPVWKLAYKLYYGGKKDRKISK